MHPLVAIEGNPFADCLDEMQRLKNVWELKSIKSSVAGILATGSVFNVSSRTPDKLSCNGFVAMTSDVKNRIDELLVDKTKGYLTLDVMDGDFCFTSGGNGHVMSWNGNSDAFMEIRHLRVAMLWILEELCDRCFIMPEWKCINQPYWGEMIDVVNMLRREFGKDYINNVESWSDEETEMYFDDFGFIYGLPDYWGKYIDSDGIITEIMHCLNDVKLSIRKSTSINRLMARYKKKGSAKKQVEKIVNSYAGIEENSNLVEWCRRGLSLLSIPCGDSEIFVTEYDYTRHLENVVCLDMGLGLAADSVGYCFHNAMQCDEVFSERLLGGICKKTTSYIKGRIKCFELLSEKMTWDC